LGTIEELAKRTGVSKPTTTRWLRQLSGVEGPKRYFVINPLLDYYNMGLEATDVLLETPSLEAVLTLEQIAKAHPYTAYRCRCYGAYNGVLLQFRTPIGSSSRVRELVDLLRHAGLVTRSRFLTTTTEPTVYTSLRIDGWRADTLTWEFDWERWFSMETAEDTDPRPHGREPGNVLQWLTERDLNILYELMRDARRKNVEIIRTLQRRGLSITPQTFSRRLRLIREHCINGYRVTFNPEAFDIYSNIIIFGRGDRQELAQLRARLQTEPIPFESTLRVIEDEMMWFVRLQATHLSPLLTNLYSLLTDMQVCIVDYPHSYIYYIWPETLDEERHEWRTDRAFMVEDVLSQVIG